MIYRDHKGRLILHSPMLGSIYDRVLLLGTEEECPEESLPWIDISTDLRTKLHAQLNKDISSYAESSTVSLSMAEISLEKQASTFLSLIEGLMSQSQSNSATLTPVFFALRACINAGWKPINLPKVNHVQIIKNF